MKETRYTHRLPATVFISITLLISISSYSQWIQKPDAFKTRSEVPSTVYNSKLYTFLGFSNSSLETEPSSEVYDPATNTWKLLTSIPTNESRTHQGVVLVDSTVWHIGGRVGKNPGPLTSSIWIYNISKNIWYRGPQITDPATGEPIPWAAGGAALLGRTLHIIGGFIINACNNDQSTYHLTLDVDSWLADTSKPAKWMNTLAPLPVKRNHFGTVVLGGKIYVIGGQFGHDCGGGQDKPYSHVYNPATDTWTELPLLPTPRSHIEGGTFAMDGKIYVVAGQGTNGASTNKVTIFDPAANNGAGSWHDDLSLTLGQSYEGVSSKVINNTFIYSHGGEGSSANTRKETYSRTIARNPVYKLGFSSGCLNLTTDTEQIVKGKTLLFTIDSSKSYTTSSNAAWLTVTKNASGLAIPNAVDVEVTANTSGLAPGTYNGTITATGTGAGQAYTAATYCVNLTVKTINSINSSSDTLQAETATLSGVKVASNNSGFTGTGFADYINSSADYIQWSLNKPVGGSTLLNFRYANGATTNRPLQLEVNGVVLSSSLAFPSTGSWSKWSFVTATVNLNTGINTIKLTAMGSSGPNIDYLITTDNTLQAESATLYGARVASNNPGFTGTGFADYINSTGDYVQWSLNKLMAGATLLNFRYANGATTDRPLKLEVNGVLVSSGLSFPSTGSWSKWSSVTTAVNLNTGINTVKLTATWSSGPNIDCLTISDTTIQMANRTPADKSIILNGSNSLKAYVSPNPASGNVRLLMTTSSTAPINMELMDMSGKTFKNMKLANNGLNSFNFSVRDLPAGIYIIRVKQGNNFATTKFVVNNKTSK
ncbi:Kelch repeat-containing protein [Segetibacter koreensis]|uniref:Kelch repeat-containing protein n=1 Tax=Segetibacter koreensis TaxID=398037 RepID=UPI0003745FC8|nr:carbohydrate-binding protein [Segetibacter koreensis]